MNEPCRYDYCGCDKRRNEYGKGQYHWLAENPSMPKTDRISGRCAIYTQILGRIAQSKVSLARLENDAGDNAAMVQRLKGDLVFDREQLRRLDGEEMPLAVLIYDGSWKSEPPDTILDTF